MESKVCDWCGTLFLPKYRVTQKYWAKRRFCSEDCRRRGFVPPPRTGVTVPVLERFWKKVSVCIHGRTCKDCCWLWTGAHNKDGYGKMFRGKTQTHYKAHRLAYELFIGPIPEGLHVLHDCPDGDTPACVNYNGHLWLGTQADNNADRDAKGRGGAKGGHVADRRGMKNGHARIPDATIEAIRALYATGEWSQDRLAATFGCGQSQISRIVRGEQRQPVTTPWVKPSLACEEG